MRAGGPGTRRALVIGLDGLPLSLARQLAAAGTMPCLGALLDGGSTAELIAPVPEVSSTSWATFLTGANPARHGIFGFTDLRPGSYEVYFPNLTHLRAPPLWDRAAELGLATLSLNVPGTYPAPRINGAVVSGFVAPLAERAVQPPRLAEAIHRFGYQIEAEVGDVAAQPGAFVGRLQRALASRERLFSHLLVTEPWDLAVMIVTETDRLQHFLWRQLSDPREELHELTVDFYRDVDATVASLISCAGGDTEVFVISDHGFGPAHCQFHANAWLRARGWLAPPSVSPQLTALEGSTQIFALDPCRFYLHRKDRFPAGGLSPGQADDLAAELAAALRELRWRDGAVGPELDGPLLISEVYLRDEIYHGPLADRAPDVVAVPAAGVQLRGAWRGDTARAPGIHTGAHTRGDALLWTSISDITAGIVDMADVAPTILGCLGADQAHIAGLDGRDLSPAASPSRSR
jgi:predicted AlkP superfamily phosphohydrolase/phosphomutase